MIIIKRIIQKLMYLMMFFIKFREPIILSNLDELKDTIDNKYHIKNILILSGKRVKETDYYKNLVNKLNNYSISCYDEIPSDPDLQSIEKAVQYSIDNKIELIIAIGGGSTMDACKIIASRITNNISIPKMRGMLKIKKQPLDFILIPTTAGTGSECTVASVVSDLDNNQKYAISDPKLIPYYTVLDPLSQITLPKFFIATTGMDALTHAVEAYIGKATTKKTRKDSIDAIKLIFDNLYLSYTTPDLEAKKNMQIASYKAGLAFTRSYVGYVHAISHSIAANFHLSHGYLNAVILPYVLNEYNNKIDKKIYKLMLALNYIDKDTSKRDATIKFISMIKELNQKLDIDESLNLDLNDEVVNKMIIHCKKEVGYLYPVVCYFNDKTLKKLYNIIGNKK